MVIWQKTIGIFEDKGGWVTANDPHHATNGIELTDFTAEGNDMLSELIVIKFDAVEDLDMEFSRLAGRKNLMVGIGAGAFTINIRCLLIADGSKEAEERINDILGFIRSHDEMTDPDIYMVVSRKVNTTWYYILFENPSTGNNDRKYLQGKLRAAKPIYKSFGVYEINLQFTEANI